MAESEPADWSRWNSLGIIHALQGNVDLADTPLNCLIEKLAGRAAVQIAMNYAAKRDADNTFLWLERAHAQRDSGLAFLKSNWIYENLYGDPRWMVFLQKMGLDN